jgi:hypothetical protein
MRAARRGERDVVFHGLFCLGKRPMKVRHAAALAEAFGNHSTISRLTLQLFRAATALMIVRIDFAVRPCLPITLPKSSFATRNSSSVAASPRVSQ